MSESEKPNKKPRLDHNNNKDATVVVGGKEFQEDSHQLIYLCGYFRGAIRSGMEESKSLQFNFPDKDPAEWELFKAAFEPFSSVVANKNVVTKENVVTVLRWCNELCVTADCSRLEATFWSKIMDILPFGIVMSHFKSDRPLPIDAPLSSDKTLRLLEALEDALELQLDVHTSLIECVLKKYLSTYPWIFDSSSLPRFLEILQGSERLQTLLWESIHPLIPLDLLQEKSCKELLSNDMFSHVLLLSLTHRKEMEKKISTMKNRIISELPNRLYNSLTKRTTDDYCRYALQYLLAEDDFWEYVCEE